MLSHYKIRENGICTFNVIMYSVDEFILEDCIKLFILAYQLNSYNGIKHFILIMHNNFYVYFIPCTEN